MVDKINSNFEKTKKLHSEFRTFLKREKVPSLLLVGVVSKRDGTPKFFEVILKRPDRYSSPFLVKLLPKKFKGVNVRVL